MAYNPNDPSDIAGTGAAIGGAIAQIGTIFQDRFARKQYDDFLAGPSKEYQASMAQAQELMLDEDNADAPQQAVHIIKNATTSFMDNATRYKNNPYIMEKATRVWEGHMGFLKDEFTARFQAAKEERAQGTAERNAELQPLRKENLEADIAKKKAEAGKAERWQPTASEADLKNVPQFLSGNPEELSQITDPGARASAARTNVLARINTPRDERQRDQINLGIKNEARTIAQSLVSERAARGEMRPKWMDDEGNAHLAEPWNASDPDHVAAAMAMIDPALPKEQYILKTIQGESQATGVDPKVADDKFGVLVDPGRATPNNPVTRPVSEDELGKVLLGGRGMDWERQKTVAEVGDDKKPIKNKKGETIMRPPRSLQEAASNLPESYTQLSGIIGDSVKTAAAVLKERQSAGETLTLDEIRKTIRKSSLVNVGSILGGKDALTEDLPVGIRRNREDAKIVIDAAAEKYAEQLAVALGLIEAPEAKAAETKEDTGPGFSIGNEFIKKFTPFGTVGARIDQAKGLLQDKEKKK